MPRGELGSWSTDRGATARYVTQANYKSSFKRLGLWNQVAEHTCDRKSHIGWENTEQRGGAVSERLAGAFQWDKLGCRGACPDETTGRACGGHPRRRRAVGPHAL